MKQQPGTDRFQRKHTRPSLMMLGVFSASLTILLTPAEAEAETLKSTPQKALFASRLSALSFGSFRRIPASLRYPRRLTARAKTSPIELTVELQGSYSVLPRGDVVVYRSGSVVAEGSALNEIEVPRGSSIDLAVTATGLVDRPTINITGVTLPSSGDVLTVPVNIETGLVRALAYQDGRRIAGVVRFHRIDEATGEADGSACGSMGAVGSSQEISAGRYLAVLYYRGAVLREVVNVAPGSSRLVRLDG